MSTRSQTRINMGGERVLTFYRHCDGYPEGHGVELCDAIENAGDDVIELLNLLKEHRIEIEPADCREHGDIEYLYEVNYPDPYMYYPDGRPDVTVRVTQTASWKERKVIYEGTTKSVRERINER